MAAGGGAVRGLGDAILREWECIEALGGILRTRLDVTTRGPIRGSHLGLWAQFNPDHIAKKRKSTI